MRRVVALVLLVSFTSGCASSRTAVVERDDSRIEVLAPVDGVPVTANEIFSADSDQTGRENGLRLLRDGLVGVLLASGADACGGEPLGISGPRALSASLAARARADGMDVVIATELIAYGQVRRSWLWLLLGQGLVAGVGHGVVVREATGKTNLGWWAGVGEFAVETVTWVGGALFASRLIDPVVLRVTAVRARDGAVIGTWTREGTSPFKSWAHRKDLPPRAERLRLVARRAFAKLAPTMLTTIAAWQRPFRELPKTHPPG